MTSENDTDPFVQFKAQQREGWALFAPLEGFTTPPAAKLVRFAGVAAGQVVLDVACGTGVVAVTAARSGASVRGLDLSPVLLERAAQNARIAAVDVESSLGTPRRCPTATPRSTWCSASSATSSPPVPGWSSPRCCASSSLAAGSRLRRGPPSSSPPGVDLPAPPLWGDPNVVCERLGSAVKDLVFERDTMVAASLSPRHSLAALETTLGPLVKIVALLANDPPRLARLRTDLLAQIEAIFRDNATHQHFLLTRATKL